jgi:hypothetical protein
LDPSRLGLSLTKCLSLASATHKDSKIDQIEYELQEIAEDVKKNIGQIFERGEKVEMLASKSQQLRSTVRIVKLNRFIYSLKCSGVGLLK